MEDATQLIQVNEEVVMKALVNGCFFNFKKINKKLFKKYRHIYLYMLYLIQGKEQNKTNLKGINKMTTYKTSTNKAMVKDGLNAMEILEILENRLTKMDEIDQDSIELTGDEDSEILYFSDFKERNYEVVLYHGELETLFFNTSNKEDEETEEKNVKTFKSVGALLNQVDRMNK